MIIHCKICMYVYVLIAFIFTKAGHTDVNYYKKYASRYRREPKPMPLIKTTKEHVPKKIVLENQFSSTTRKNEHHAVQVIAADGPRRSKRLRCRSSWCRRVDRARLLHWRN